MRITNDVAVSELPPPVQADAYQQSNNAKPALYQPSDQSFTLFTTKALDDSIANIKDGWNRIVHPDSWGGFVHGTIELSGNLVPALGADLAANLQQGAQWVNGKVNGIPVVQNLVKPLGDGVNGFGAAVGDVFDGFGQSANDFGSAFEHLSHGDFKQAAESVYDSGKDVVVGAYDAGKDVVNSVVDSVKDFFSW
jgi:hypothetical protein